MTRPQMLVWSGLGVFRAEVAHVELEDDRLRARGTQIGLEPEAYELRYELDTTSGFVTERLSVHAHSEAGPRSLQLLRGVSEELEWGPDCDLGFSPLTNTMPILRGGLHKGGGRADFVMAWVSVPDLSVHRSPQRYEYLRPGVVRYEGVSSGFVADLELDDDGFVTRYPGLAERLHPR